MRGYDDFQPDPAQLVPLEEPREPTAEERAAMEALVAPLGLPALEEQVEHAEVVSACTCGCPSVGLRTDGPPLDRDEVRRLSPQGPNDVVSIATTQPFEDCQEVDVILHLVDGRLEELEIWAGSLA